MPRARIITPAQAARNWVDRTIEAKGKWADRTAGAGDAYRAGIARFLGIGVEQIPVGLADDFRRGVQAVTPEAFAATIRGKEDEWLAGYKAGVTRAARRL